MKALPIRIQRKRIKGWRLPPNTVCVDRTTRWGNPFVIGKDGDVRQCLSKYNAEMFPYRHHGPTSGLDSFYLTMANIKDIAFSLRGKNLACFCPLDQPCHADILLEVANDTSYDDHDYPGDDTHTAKRGSLRSGKA